MIFVVGGLSGNASDDTEYAAGFFQMLLGNEPNCWVPTRTRNVPTQDSTEINCSPE